MSHLFKNFFRAALSVTTLLVLTACGSSQVSDLADDATLQPNAITVAILSAPASGPMNLGVSGPMNAAAVKYCAAGSATLLTSTCGSAPTQGVGFETRYMNASKPTLSSKQRQIFTFNLTSANEIYVTLIAYDSTGSVIGSRRIVLKPKTSSLSPLDPNKLVNRADYIALLNAHNQTRTRMGLKALRLNETLCRAATKHAEHLAKIQYRPGAFSTLSHYQNGTPQSRATAEGYTGKESYRENYFWNISDPDDIVSGWMNSPGHRVQIVATSINEVGFGIVKGSNGWHVVAAYGRGVE